MAEHERRTDDLALEDVMARFEAAYGKALDELGRFNLVIFGKTGVGKSTLVNAIFGAEVAKTGTGRPVTLSTEYYEHPAGYLGIYDSEGIEVGQHGDRILDKFRELIRSTHAGPIGEQIHVIWYCVRAADLRLEEGQEAFIRALADEGLPVLFVLTQVAMNQAGQVHPKAREFAESIVERDLPLSPDNRVFLTMAQADEFARWPRHGLTELLDATFRAAPAGAAQALTAAQVIDVARKARLARRSITAAVATAASAGATPIPFSDAFVLVPIQMTLMARIAAVYGLSVRVGTLASVAGAALAAGGLTQAGRYAVTSLLKFVPGANVAASGIRASVAGSFTYALGEAWLVVCGQLLKMGPAAETVGHEEVKAMFLDQFTTKARETPRRLAGKRGGPVPGGSEPHDP